MTSDSPELPKYDTFAIPSVRAVDGLGGSATSKEIVNYVLDEMHDSESLLTVSYPGRPESSVLVHRIQFGRSCAKLIGALESPARGTFLLTSLGRELLDLDDADPNAAYEWVRELDREYRRNRRRATHNLPVPKLSVRQDTADEHALLDTDEEAADTPTSRWPEMLLARLHRLSPTAFEKFVLYLLRQYGLELHRVGGPGDEGVDGIGTAPLSPVLSSRVAVQVKRYDPNGKPIGRDVVALFQRDAQTKGAERAILVTLGRYTEAARKAATVTSPTVDLIDGDRVAALVLQKEIGVRLAPEVDGGWFDRFDN